MNPFDQQIERQTIDSLVDGELSTSKRRAVLEQLEATPGAWRRCALAFLEAQSWGQMARDVTASRDAGPASIEKRSHRGTTSRAAWLAIAAGIVLAFGIGRMSLSGNPETSDPLSNTVANSSRVTTPDIGQGQQHPGSQAISPRFVLQKPILVESDREAIPDDIQRYLNSIGRQAELRRGYLPVEFEDGRRGVVPMEEVNIVPVVNELY